MALLLRRFVRPLSLFVSLISLLWSTLAPAEAIYKWRDEQGRLHFSTSPKQLTPAVKAVDVPHIPPDRSNASRQRWLLQQEARQLERKTAQKEQLHAEQKAMLKEEQYLKVKKKALCGKYSERYQRYREEGVQGINLATGEVKPMRGPAKTRAIESTKAMKDALCD